MFKCVTSTLVVCMLVVGISVYAQEPQPMMVPVQQPQPQPYQNRLDLHSLPPTWQNFGVREQWQTTTTHDIKPIREYENYIPRQQYYYPQQQYQYYCPQQTYRYQQCYPQYQYHNTTPVWSIPYFLGGENLNCPYSY